MPAQRNRHKLSDPVVAHGHCNRRGKGDKYHELYAEQHKRVQGLRPNACYAAESRDKHPCDPPQIHHQNRGFDSGPAYNIVQRRHSTCGQHRKRREYHPENHQCGECLADLEPLRATQHDEGQRPKREVGAHVSSSTDG